MNKTGNQVKKSMRKVLASLLIIAMISGLMPPLNVAAATNETEPSYQVMQIDGKEVVVNKTYMEDFSFPSFVDPGERGPAFGILGRDGKDLTDTCFYSDDYFSTPAVNSKVTKGEVPWTELDNQRLATMSIALAMSAFGSNVDNFSKKFQYWRGDYSYKYRNVEALLKKLDFTDFHKNDWFTKKPETDSIGMAEAQKRIRVTDPDGVARDYMLRAVAVRGAGYESEWASNVSIGSDCTNQVGHQGFNDAAQKVFKEIQKYDKEHSNEGLPVKYWIVGYSRAGATANLTSGLVTDNAASLNTTQNDVYGYTFEAPQGAATFGGRSLKQLKYKNIHNIVNKMDLVPKVSPTLFGHQRLGIDYQLPYWGSNGNVSRSEYSQLKYRTRYNLPKGSGMEEIFMRYPDSKEGVDIYTFNILGLGTEKREKGTKKYQLGGLGKTPGRGGYGNQPLMMDEVLDELMARLCTSKAWGAEEADRSTNEAVNKMTYFNYYQNDFRQICAWVMGGGMDGSSGIISKVLFGDFFIDIIHSFANWKEFVLVMNSSTWSRDSVLYHQKKTLYQKIKNMAERAVKGLGADEETVKAVRHVIPVFIEMMLYDRDDNYQNFLGTLLTYSGDLFTTHVPEVTFAWLKTLDDQYLTADLQKKAAYTATLEIDAKNIEKIEIYNDKLMASWTPEAGLVKNPKAIYFNDGNSFVKKGFGNKIELTYGTSHNDKEIYIYYAKGPSKLNAAIEARDFAGNASRIDVLKWLPEDQKKTDFNKGDVIKILHRSSSYYRQDPESVVNVSRAATIRIVPEGIEGNPYAEEQFYKELRTMVDKDLKSKTGNKSELETEYDREKGFVVYDSAWINTPDLIADSGSGSRQKIVKSYYITDDIGDVTPKGKVPADEKDLVKLDIYGKFGINLKDGYGSRVYHVVYDDITTEAQEFRLTDCRMFYAEDTDTIKDAVGKEVTYKLDGNVRCYYADSGTKVVILPDMEKINAFYSESSGWEWSSFCQRVYRFEDYDLFEEMGLGKNDYMLYFEVPRAALLHAVIQVKQVSKNVQKQPIKSVTFHNCAPLISGDLNIKEFAKTAAGTEALAFGGITVLNGDGDLKLENPKGSSFYTLDEAPEHSPIGFRLINTFKAGTDKYYDFKGWRQSDYQSGNGSSVEDYPEEADGKNVNKAGQKALIRVNPSFHDSITIEPIMVERSIDIYALNASIIRGGRTGESMSLGWNKQAVVKAEKPEGPYEFEGWKVTDNKGKDVTDKWIAKGNLKKPEITITNRVESTKNTMDNLEFYTIEALFKLKVRKIYANGGILEVEDGSAMGLDGSKKYFSALREEGVSIPVGTTVTLGGGLHPYKIFTEGSNDRLIRDNDKWTGQYNGSYWFGGWTVTDWYGNRLSEKELSDYGINPNLPRQTFEVPDKDLKFSYKPGKYVGDEEEGRERLSVGLEDLPESYTGDTDEDYFLRSEGGMPCFSEYVYEGAYIQLSAPEKWNGKQFYCWQAYTRTKERPGVREEKLFFIDMLAEAKGAKTAFYMPNIGTDKRLYLVPVYLDDGQTVDLKVEGGAAIGQNTFRPGDIVYVKANEPGASYAFTGWSCNSDMAEITEADKMDSFVIINRRAAGNTVVVKANYEKVDYVVRSVAGPEPLTAEKTATVSEFIESLSKNAVVKGKAYSTDASRQDPEEVTVIVDWDTEGLLENYKTVRDIANGGISFEINGTLSNVAITGDGKSRVMKLDGSVNRTVTALVLLKGTEAEKLIPPTPTVDPGTYYSEQKIKFNVSGLVHGYYSETGNWPSALITNTTSVTLSGKPGEVVTYTISTMAERNYLFSKIRYFTYVIDRRSEGGRTGVRTISVNKVDGGFVNTTRAAGEKVCLYASDYIENREDYVLDKWKLLSPGSLSRDGSVLTEDDYKDNILTFTMPDENVELTPAINKKIDKVYIDIACSENELPKRAGWKVSENSELKDDVYISWQTYGNSMVASFELPREKAMPGEGYAKAFANSNAIKLYLKDDYDEFREISGGSDPAAEYYVNSNGDLCVKIIYNDPSLIREKDHAVYIECFDLGNEEYLADENMNNRVIISVSSNEIARISAPLFTGDGRRLKGEVFDHWTLDDKIRLEGGTEKDKDISFVMPDGDVFLTANYVPVVQSVDLGFIAPKVGEHLPENIMYMDIESNGNYSVEDEYTGLTWENCSPEDTVEYDTLYTMKAFLKSDADGKILMRKVVDESGYEVDGDFKEVGAAFKVAENAKANITIKQFDKNGNSEETEREVPLVSDGNGGFYAEMHYYIEKEQAKAPDPDEILENNIDYDDAVFIDSKDKFELYFPQENETEEPSRYTFDVWVADNAMLADYINKDIYIRTTATQDLCESEWVKVRLPGRADDVAVESIGIDKGEESFVNNSGSVLQYSVWYAGMGERGEDDAVWFGRDDEIDAGQTVYLDELDSWDSISKMFFRRSASWDKPYSFAGKACEIPVNRPAAPVVEMSCDTSKKGTVSGQLNEKVNKTLEIECRGREDVSWDYRAIVETDSEGWFEVTGLNFSPVVFRLRYPAGEGSFASAWTVTQPIEIGNTTELLPVDVVIKENDSKVLEITKTYGDPSFTLTAEAADTSATNPKYTWSVNGPAIAKVSSTGTNGEKGLVVINAAGTTVIRVDYKSAGNYGSATLTLKVDPKGGVTITGLSAKNKEYDGTVIAEVTGTPVINGILPADKDKVEVEYGYAEFENANAGTAKAVTFKEFDLKGSASKNYVLSAQPVSVTADITKSQYQDSEKVTLYRNEGDYKITQNLSDAMPNDAGNTGYTAGTPVVKAGMINVSNFNVTSDGVLSADITDAREGARVILPVTISSTNFGDINYTVEMVIRKKERVTVSINQGASITKTYGDPSFTLTAALTPVTEIDLNDHTARIAWSSSDPTVAEVNTDSGEVKIKKAGNVKITAEIESKTLSGNAEMDLTVNRKKVSVAGYYVEDKIYDGTTGGTVKGEPVLNGLIGSDEVTVSASGTPAATFMDADNVKTQATVSDNCVVAFSGVTFSLNGADAVNYELDSSRQQPLAGRAAITKRTVSVNGITVEDRYYENGNTTITMKGCDTAVLTGIVASDSGRVALRYDEAVAAVDDANAANGKIVTVTGLDLTGDMAYNYMLTEPEFTVNILKAQTTEIQKTLSINQLYEDTDVKISVAGLMPEDAGMLSYDITEPATATEDISVSGFKVSSDGLVTAKLTIVNERKTGTVTLPVNIHSQNYEDVEAAVVVNIINKKRAKLSLINGGDSITKTYGDPDFDLASVIRVEGDTGGVIKGVSYDPTVADIAYEGTGAGKIEITGGGETTIWAEYESADYYGSMDFTLIVNKKAVTVSGVKANDKVYDGNVSATVDISEVKIEGVLDRDSADKKGKDYLTIEVGTAAFNNKHTGKDKAVECKGFTLGGEGAYDYVLVKQPALKASVTKRPITVKLTAYGRTYTPLNPIVELAVDSVSGIVDNEVVIDTKDLIGIIDEPDAGTHEVTVEGIELKSNTPDGDPKDYTIIREPSTLTVEITKANLGDKSTFNMVRTYLAGETSGEKFNLAALLPRENSSDDYEVTYFVSEVEGNLVFAGEAGKPAANDDVLSYTLTGEKSDNEAGHAHFSVEAVMQNYDNYIFEFDLKLSELALYEKTKTGYTAHESWQLPVGGNVTLVPVFNGNIADKNVVYESSNPNVAAIDPNGRLTGISSGETLVTATGQFLNDGKNYTAAITVLVNDPVSELILDRKSCALGLEDAIVIQADILPRTALNRLKWTSTGSGEVTLRPTGDTMKCVVTAKKEGTVKVTAESMDGSGVKAVCSVKIGKAIGEFTINAGGKKALEAGKKLNMKVNWAAKPVNPDVFWSVSTADGDDCRHIATINSKGVLTGHSEGEVVVTAFSVSDSSKKAQMIVPVYVPVKKVSLYADTEEMNGEVTGIQINADISSKIEGMNATGVNLCEVPTVRYSVDPDYKKYIELDEETGLITPVEGAGDKNNIPVKATVTAFNGYKKELTYKISTGALKSIKLSSKKLNIDQGMTVPLTAEVNALSADTKIEWNASPEGCVTINGNGTITGAAPGTATVTVTAKKGEVTAKAECKVTVGPAVEGIVFKNGSTLKNGGLAVNKSFTLKPEFSRSGNGKPASGTLIWKSSNPSVAEVNEKGVIKAVSAGRVTVTAALASNEDVREELEFSVYVPVKKIVADRKKLTIATTSENRVGLIYVGTVTPEEATNKDIIWRVSSGNGKVKLLAVSEPAIASEFTDKDFKGVKTDSTATVGTNQTLAVYAVAPGTVKLTGMTLDGTKKKVNCTVTVRGTVTGLALSETEGKDGSGNITKTSDGVYSSNISAGKSVTLKPVVIIDGVDPAADKKTWNLYKKYTDTTVFYRSSDTNIATVDSKGKVSVNRTAAAGSTVTISINSIDGRKNTLNVTVK